MTILAVSPVPDDTNLPDDQCRECAYCQRVWTTGIKRVWATPSRTAEGDERSEARAINEQAGRRFAEQRFANLIDLIAALNIAQRAAAAEDTAGAQQFVNGMVDALEAGIARRYGRGKAETTVEIVGLLVDEAIDQSMKTTGTPYGGGGQGDTVAEDIEDAVTAASRPTMLGAAA